MDKLTPHCKKKKTRKPFETNMNETKNCRICNVFLGIMILSIYEHLQAGVNEAEALSTYFYQTKLQSSIHTIKMEG